MPLTPGDRFAATWRFFQLDQLLISHCSFTPQRFAHDPRVQRQCDPAYLLLELYLSGTGRGLVADTPTRIDPGRLHLVDLSRPYRTVTDRVCTWGVCIPHAAVAYDPSRHAPYHQLPLSSAAGCMLAGALLSLCKRLPAVTSGEAPALAAGLATLVRSLMLGEQPADPAPVLDAEGRCLRTYVDAHLHDPALDADLLCRRFHLSRASLYRHFGDAGGVRAYIRSRRLQRCYRELAAAPAVRGAVRRVAERWGFHNAAHFNRLFKQRFGITPSDWLGGSHRPGRVLAAHSGAGDGVNPLRDWLLHP